MAKSLGLYMIQYSLFILLPYKSMVLKSSPCLTTYSCSHLTSFGAQFSLAPNDLDFRNIEDFFE